MSNEEEKEMSTVDTMYADFCKRALGIPGFKVGQKEDVEYDITDLANGYIKAMHDNDGNGMDKYISALMVRYWHMVPYLWDKSKSSRLGMEDMVMWVYDGLAKAFKYQSWLDPNKPISKDPKGAEKCFNQCITSIRQYWYKHFNTSQSKANYISSSLDALYEVLGDSMDDCLPQEQLQGSGSVCREIISTLVSEGKLFDAIVIDKLCFDDSFRETKGKKKVTIVTDSGEVTEDIQTIAYSFDQKRLVSIIKSIDEEYVNEFSKAYGVSKEDITNVLAKYAKSNVGTRIQEVFSRVKGDEKVASMLC